MDDFVQAYEKMVLDVEQVVAQYPAEMQEELRAHAQEVLRTRLQDLWAERERQKRQARLC